MKVTIVSLFRVNSNPNRPKEDRQNVALEFIIRPLIQVKIPDSESSEVKWWKTYELNKLDFAFDHKETISIYLKYRMKAIKLPICV
ncbi:MAG: hypothetical protein V1858_03660 [Candidatus Gottesmanbacteria bacterium]